MPIVEIVTFPASELLIADISKAQETLNIVSKAEGFIEAYGGIQLEDKKTAYFLMVWGTIEDPKKFAADTERYAELKKARAPLAEGPSSADFVEFNNDHTSALSAPVTEVAVIASIKEGKTKEELDAAVAGIVEVVKDTPGLHLPAAFGEVIDKPGRHYLLGGWDSVQAHMAIRGNEKAVAAVGKFKSVGEGSMAHVALKKFEFA